MSRLKAFLPAGEIVGTHGIRGEWRVKPLCDSPEQLAHFTRLYWDEAGEHSLKITARAHGNLTLIKAAGIDAPDTAAAYRGKILYARRADFKLEPGRYFVADMLGMTVLDEDTGEAYGEIKQVFATGANDVYALARPDGKEVLIPAIDSVVIRREMEKGELFIRPMKGLFGDAP